MKSDKFEKYLNNIEFDDKPDYSHRDELEQRLLTFLAGKSSQKLNKKWAWSDRGLRFAAAAMIFIVVIIGIHFLDTPIDRASTVFAAAMDNIKQARTFSCIVIMEGLYDDYGELKKFLYKNKVLFKEPDCERREELTSPWQEEEGKITIINFSKQLALTIKPFEKTAELHNVTDGDELNTSMRDFLIEESLGTFDDLGNVELNGQIVRMIRSTDKAWVYTIWVDQKTNYPVQIELKLPEQNFIPILYTSIQIDTELDDKLFSLEPPEGFELKFTDAAERKDFYNVDTIPQTSGKQKAFLSINEILDKWEAGYGSILSMKVKYTEDITLPDPNGKETILHTTVETIQDGKKYCYKYFSSNPDFRRSEGNRERAYDGEISTSYKYFEYNLPRPIMYGEIAKKDLKSAELGNGNSLAQYMMLSRYYLNPKYPDGETYFAFWVRSRLNESRLNLNSEVKIRPELETVLGESCHVVEASHGNDVQRFWLAHNKSLLVMKYEIFDKRGQFVQDRIEVLKIASVITDKGEIWYPTEIKSVTVDTTIKLGTVQTHECKV